MSFTDPIADLLTRIRNGQSSKKKYIEAPFSKMKKNILDVLLAEGYISNYEIIENESSKKTCKVFLKYYKGFPVIKELSRISKPGCRIYSSSKDLPIVNNGLGISIISTSFGIMSDISAREKGVGGEILCRVF